MHIDGDSNFLLTIFTTNKISHPNDHI
jgi:hypothetical protein